MDRKRKGKYLGIFGAVMVHAVIILLLILISIAVPKPTEESGVPVLLGDALSAGGDFDPSTLVDVDLLEEKMPETEPQKAVEQDMITQTEEETVALKPKTKPKRKNVKRPEKTEAQKAAEARRLAEEKAERERKAAAKAASKKVAGAFGKGSEMGNRGAAKDAGTEGVPTGNSSSGALTGSGGYGTFDLGGRSLGPGGLPRPRYNVQDEGRVVVTITVNPAGMVIATSINRRTNTVNSALRRAAEEAAKKARFNDIESLNNQTGTITYYFNLR